MELYGWLIALIGIFVGGEITYRVNKRLEKDKREQFKNDFKEGIFIELKEVLPYLVYYYIVGSFDPHKKIWGSSILRELKEKSSESEKLHIENMEKAMDFFIDNRMLSGAPLKLHLSLLKENIASIAILEKELKSTLIRIRTKTNHINELIPYCVSSYHKLTNPGLSTELRKAIEKDISDSLKIIAGKSFDAAELIKELIL